MTGTHTPPIIVHSDLGDPETFAEILGEFLEELPCRLDQLEGLLRSADYQQLAWFAHQLKGAGGGYGYPGLSERAATLEAQARGPQPSPEKLAECLRDLRDYQGHMQI